MSNAADHAAIFYRDVARNRRLWTIRNERGFLVMRKGVFQRLQPFWSSRSRVERIIQNVPAYSIFEPHELTWDAFSGKWVSSLSWKWIKVGVNWSGPRAVGYDWPARQVKHWIESEIQLPSGSHAGEQ